MAYTVVWLKDEKILGKTPFKTKEEAIHHAQGMGPARQKQEGANLVRVIDDDEQVIEAWPLK